MTFISIAIGLIIVNIMSHFLLGISWASVFERSFFQVFAIITLYTAS